MKQLSFGKYRALQRASTADGFFTILAVDHQDALKQPMRPDDPMSVTDEEMIRFKLDVVSVLGDAVSGVLLDPLFGAYQAIATDTIKQGALLMGLEKADYQMNPLPLDVEIDPDWTVEKLRHIADGAKLFFYYNTFESDHAARQQAVVRQLVADCKTHDIPLYAEPIAYGMSDAVDKRTLVIKAAQEMCDIGADVLKMEFPVNVKKETDKAVWLEACVEMTNAIDVPWALLSAGVSFEIFIQQLEVACQAGASGFIVGRALWGDVATMPETERLHWLKTVGKKRLGLLNAIVGLHGTPWHSHFETPSVTTDTFRQ
ncbi:MAG: tagatose 1,6-diphosphate aldolase [Anaerolineae bacterium]|nr:tagatose 1,6-diphosphate aldolase [Anaerolineae bacterium]